MGFLAIFALNSAFRCVATPAGPGPATIGPDATDITLTRRLSVESAELISDTMLSRTDGDGCALTTGLSWLGTRICDMTGAEG